MTKQDETKIEEKPVASSEITTIEGGVEVEVKHKDGSKEKVKVRQIPATKVQEFAQHLGDEAHSVSVYCDKPLEWVDSLSYESLDEIAKKGMELNLPFLNGWFQRRAKWSEVTAVGQIAKLKQQVEALVQALQSGNYAAASPSTTASPPNR